LCFDDEEFVSEEDEGDSFSEMKMDRKQRQQKLRERFLALSATIPGFQKVSVHSNLLTLITSTNYCKYLQILLPSRFTSV